MKPHVLITFISLIFLTGCLSENYIDPDVIQSGKKDILSLDGLSEQQLHLNTNKMVIYLEYKKGGEKIVVNRNQATLNFDNNDPKIVKLEAKGKFVELKNFRATNNLLFEVPEVALQEGIRRIDVSHNQLKKLPVFDKKMDPLFLDLSYNELKNIYEQLIKMQLSKGSTVDLTKTGIHCKYIIEYAKKNPGITVISDCYSAKVSSVAIVQ